MCKNKTFSIKFVKFFLSPLHIYGLGHGVLDFKIQSIFFTVASVYALGLETRTYMLFDLHTIAL